MEPMIVVGTGGLARQAIDLLEGLGCTLHFYNDERPELDFFGHPIVNRLDSNRYASGLICLSDPVTKRKFAQLFASHAIPARKLIAPTCGVSRYAEVGVGSMLLGNVIVEADAEIGEHCLVNCFALVAHESVIEDHSGIGPHVCLLGGCRIGKRTLIGANATVLPGVHVGDDIVIGANAVVPKNLTVPGIYTGSPAQLARSFSPAELTTRRSWAGPH
jgi:acetyltransferase EpsM